MKKKQGLGRGMDAIFLDNSIDAPEKTDTLRLSEIEPRRGQPRKSFDAEALSQLADSIAEIKTVCSCGEKAIINARLDGEMNVVTEGAQILLGGNDSYIAICHKCWVNKIKEQKSEE